MSQNLERPSTPRSTPKQQKTRSVRISEVVAEYKRLFWESQEPPTPLEIAVSLEVPTKSVETALLSTTAIKALSAFYIPVDRPKRLSLRQIIWANMLLNIEDTRSIRKKADEADIKIQEHNAWMKDKNFYNHIQRRAFEIFGRERWQVYMSLLQNARNGDINSIKLYLEMTGDYTPSSKVQHSGTINIDVRSTVDLLVEVVQKEVSPEQFQRIAEQFDRALSSNSTPSHSRVIDVNPLDELNEFDTSDQLLMGAVGAAQQLDTQAILVPPNPTDFEF